VLLGYVALAADAGCGPAALCTLIVLSAALGLLAAEGSGIRLANDDYFLRFGYLNTRLISRTM